MKFKFPKFIRRAFWHSRIAVFEHDIKALDYERETHGRRRDSTLRKLNDARLALFFVDINRPPIQHAPGRQRDMTTGTVRRNDTLSSILAKREKVANIEPDAHRIVRESPTLATRAKAVTSLDARTFQRPRREPKVIGEAS